MLRRWAQAQGFRPVMAAAAPVPGPTVYPPLPSVPQPAPRVVDVLAITVLESARSGMQRQAPRRRVGKLIAFMLGTAFTVLALWMWRFHRVVPSPASPVQVAASGHSATAGRRTQIHPPGRLRARNEAPVAASIETARTSAALESPPDAAYTPAPQRLAPPASLPPCPPGIDRLGCQPDPQTLKVLRGQ